MAIRRQRCLSVAMGFVAGLCAACHDGPTTPQVGDLNVSVQTSGGDIDLDGYQFVVDSARHAVCASSMAGSSCGSASAPSPEGASTKARRQPPSHTSRVPCSAAHR